MKHIKIDIPIYTWADFREWFWNKIVYPRREVCVMWISVNNDEIKSQMEKLYISEMNIDIDNKEDAARLDKYCRKMYDAINEVGTRTERRILRR